MWTLILFTMLLGTSASGGAYSTTTTLSFNSKDQCDAALSALLTHSLPVFDRSNREIGTFDIWGKCVAQSK